jgi:hypothetical protein
MCSWFTVQAYPWVGTEMEPCSWIGKEKFGAFVQLPKKDWQKAGRKRANRTKKGGKQAKGKGTIKRQLISLGNGSCPR